MPTPIHVLMLVENNAYPFDVRVRREACALQDAGYSVSVIAPRAQRQPWTEVIDGVKVYRFPEPPGGDGLLGYSVEFFYATLAMLMLSCWVFIREGIDVIHAANPPDTLFVIPALFKVFGVKFVFDHHDLAPETYLSRFAGTKPNKVYRALRMLEASSYYFSDLVIATNESYRETAISRGEKGPHQVYVVRNGPPLSFGPVQADPALTQRSRYLVGYIGTMGPQDGVDYLLRAIHDIVFNRGRRDVLTVIIGDGDTARELRSLANALNIEDFVLFTGRISDALVRSYLSSVHVCVQPDPSNPLNDKSTMNKVMEYMALERPIVAFDLPETRYSAQGSALYARPNNIAELAHHILHLLEHPEQCRQMGQLGRQRVSTALAWEHSVPYLLEAYSVGLGFGSTDKAMAGSCDGPIPAKQRHPTSSNGTP